VRGRGGAKKRKEEGYGERNLPKRSTKFGERGGEERIRRCAGTWLNLRKHMVRRPAAQRIGGRKKQFPLGVQELLVDASQKWLKNRPAQAIGHEGILVLIR